MKIKTHVYTGKDCPNHLKIVERDLPRNRIVWVSENGGRDWQRTSVGDVGFISEVIGTVDPQQIILAPDGPEFM